MNRLIEVQAYGNSIEFHQDYLIVKRTGKILECRCDVLVMTPQHAANLDWSEYVCEGCGGHITAQGHDKYNQFWGYSGYDDE